MSVRITTLCRPLAMSPPQKAVLMAMADFVHDDGLYRYSQALIVEWTCLSRRAVIDAVAWLESAGFVKVERRFGAKSAMVLQLDRIRQAAGVRGTEDQCTQSTGARDAPVQEAHQCRASTGAPPAKTSAPPAQTSAPGAPNTYETYETSERQVAPASIDAAADQSKASAEVRTAKPSARKPESKSTATWEAYSKAYALRYADVPLRSAKANSLVGRLVDTVGAEVAPVLATFYVGLDRAFYVAKLHPLDLLLNDAQALLTQMRTGYRAPDARSDGQRTQQRSGVHAGFATRNYRDGVSEDGTITL